MVVTVVLSIISENVTKMDEVEKDADVLLSAGEVEETVGAVVSIVKEVRVIVFPALSAESVTVTVQLSYVPSDKVLKSIELCPDVVAVVELEQLPP